ncbi:unnamed protein product [Mucor hiemalis]
MYMRRQRKNLRSNCLILNTLFVRLGGEVNQVVAVNSLGTHEYIYCLTLKDDLCIATSISTLILPTDISHFKPFKKDYTLWSCSNGKISCANDLRDESVYNS